MEITIVFDPKTGKIYPHGFGNHGEIIITTSGNISEKEYDRLIVRKVDTSCIDMLNWYVVEDRRVVSGQ